MDKNASLPTEFNSSDVMLMKTHTKLNPVTLTGEKTAVPTVSGATFLTLLLQTLNRRRRIQKIFRAIEN